MSTKKEDSWVLVGKDGRTHVLPYGMIFIGRAECEIILQAVSADKRHAVLFYNNEEREFHIKDLNSLTGTYVNGIRIPEQTYMKLKHLDCIRFGYVSLHPIVRPDVFYLEKDVMTKSPTTDKLSCSPKEETDIQLIAPSAVKNAEGTKPFNLFAPEVHPACGGNVITLNRTDLPPDSLPLNLTINGEIECSWGDRDGNVSDSPDYSQQSESSSCSAPANSSTTAGPDQDASSTHSSPAAMAFTVAFENEVTTPRKKFGIRDSISKFAPNKNEADNRITLQKNSKSEPSPKKLPIVETKSYELHKNKLRSNRTETKELNEDASKVKPSASFLIKKMLNTENSSRITGNKFPSEKVEMRDGQQPEVNDDRSEAGTYTVETENNDCDVEEARKKIDEVFGVIQLSSTVLMSQSLNTTSSLAKQIPCLNGRPKQPLQKSGISTRQRAVSETNPQWNRMGKGLARGKQFLPTPSNSDNSASADGLLANNSLLQQTRKTVEQPATPEKTRRSKLATSPKSPGKTKALSTLKSPVTITNNLSVLPAEKSPSNKEDPSRHRSTDSRSEGSKSPHTSAQWRKVPWNLSGSDLDLDQSKSENNSVLSDTSTEPSSHSSHSGKNKTEHGPQMRLNRAFALRRARLEADNVKRGKDNKALTGSQKAMKKSGKLSASTTALREDNIGKTNYRLTPAIAKPFVGRTALKNIDSRAEMLKRKSEMKSGHRRIESDPGKGIPVWRMESRTAPLATSEREQLTMALALDNCSDGSLQSFHRSMSCSVMNETEMPKPNAFGGSISQRDLPYNLVRSLENSIVSVSQIVAHHNMDEYHNQNHPGKELTALDSLVISAIYQLSSKLWKNSKMLLEKERIKCTKGSESWLMIDEVLPQVLVSETPEDGDLTKDLSTILKNLKKVEQSLEVLSCVLDTDTSHRENTPEKKPPLPQNFFIVDM